MALLLGDNLGVAMRPGLYRAPLRYGHSFVGAKPIQSLTRKTVTASGNLYISSPK